jgi:type IV pilus assembly protein PilW
MQESGRYALETLGKAIRQAGYRSNAAAAFPGVSLNSTASNVITVQYSAQDGGEADCTGTVVAAGGLVTYAFAVNGSNQLTCNGFVMADNIESLNITYGIDAAKDGVLDGPYQAFGSVADFTKVAAVQVVLGVIGSTNNAATGGGYLRQSYTATFTVRNQAL